MRRRAILAAALAAGVALSMSGCALAEAVTPPVEAALYPSMADATGPDATIAVPSWVPADALNIQLKTNTKTGAVIMQYADLAPEPIGAPCDPAIAGNEAQLEDTWWPQSIPPESVVCQDGWHLFSPNGTQFFAWTP